MAKCKVLIVDDDPDILLLFSHFFQDAGATVTTLEEPVKAMELMASNNSSFDLVVVDIRMPAMNGNELTRSIRNTGFTGGVVAFTANVTGEGRKQSQDSGIDTYFNKQNMTKDLALALIEKYGALATEIQTADN